MSTFHCHGRSVNSFYFLSVHRKKRKTKPTLFCFVFSGGKRGNISRVTNRGRAHTCTHTHGRRNEGRRVEMLDECEEEREKLKRKNRLRLFSGLWTLFSLSRSFVRSVWEHTEWNEKEKEKKTDLNFFGSSLFFFPYSFLHCYSKWNIKIRKRRRRRRRRKNMIMAKK